MSRIFTTSVSSVYPHHVAKVEKKGAPRRNWIRSSTWLTGFDEDALAQRLADGTTFEEFFAQADLNPDAKLITGVVCGVRVEDVEDPLMQQIRYLDKLVDELARGKAMEDPARMIIGPAAPRSGQPLGETLRDRQIQPARGQPYRHRHGPVLQAGDAHAVPLAEITQAAPGPEVVVPRGRIGAGRPGRQAVPRRRRRLVVSSVATVDRRSTVRATRTRS